jgi:hypothetical protein
VCRVGSTYCTYRSTYGSTKLYTNGSTELCAYSVAIRCPDGYAYVRTDGAIDNNNNKIGISTGDASS